MEETNNTKTLNEALEKIAVQFATADSGSNKKNISIYINNDSLVFSVYVSDYVEGMPRGTYFTDPIPIPQNSTTKDIIEGLTKTIRKQCNLQGLQVSVPADMDQIKWFALTGTDTENNKFTIEVHPNDQHLEWTIKMAAKYHNPEAYPGDKDLEGCVATLKNLNIIEEERDLNEGMTY